MKLRKQFVAPLVIFAILMACNKGLPPSLQRDVVLENDKIQSALQQVDKSESSLNNDLLRGTPDSSGWRASLDDAKSDLHSAQNDGSELTRLVQRNRPDRRISQLLADEERLRQSALKKVQSVDQATVRWMDYKKDPAAFTATLDHERQTIKAFDVAPIAKVVHKAELDWPAKKSVLESKLTALTYVDKPAETPSQLIAQEETIGHRASTLTVQASELQSECGQLYDSWDKILTDLDHSQYGVETLYRERLKTVRTHFIDVPLKKTETHSDEHWLDVSEASFHSVENDIGMAIAHKDAGLFDSEAQNTPQPPGFSYVASPSVGSNQYGYWSHNGGESVWTWLPQYLILRELLWNHDYHPVMVNEYNAYRTAQSSGTTYYGRETPNAAPKYGTHGTFTQSHYADSRYVQSGGFRGSGYASNGSAQSRFSPQAQPGGPKLDPNAGHRFGRQPGAEPSGHQFGRAPSARPPGRSFGRRR